MKKKVLILALALVLIIPVMLFATACGGSKTKAKITLATTDKSKISCDYAGWSFPVNSSITSAPVYGYNIYDYSELKVLVNGEVVNDNSIFQPNDFSINSYDGSRVRIGTLYFGTFKENTTISFDESSIKDVEIKIGFIHNSDSRLDWIFDTTGPYTEKGSDTNLSTFKSNYKVKINNSDLEKLEEQQDIKITPDKYGLVSAEYLFSNDTDYQITDSSKENKYSPYMFTYNVSDFFEFDSSAYHAKPMFLYSENGFGYYNFENDSQSNAPCGKNYEFEVGSLIESAQEQYYDYTIGDYSRSTIQIDNDEIVYFKDMADKGVDVKNMSNMKLNFYDNNLIILSTDNMKTSNFEATVENYASSITTELDGSSTNICPIGNVNTNRTFYATTLNDEAVSGFDFSETVVSINDTIIPEKNNKTDDDIAWYELKNTNGKEGKEYFEITIAKDILPVDFYTNEDFETFESYLPNTTEYKIKVDNIKVGDDLTGVAKLTVTTNKEKGDMGDLVIDRIWPDSTNIYMDLDSNIQKNLYYKISGDHYNDSPMLHFETSQMFVKYNTMKFKITSGSEEYNINLQEIQQGNSVHDEDVGNTVNKYTINEANIDLMFLQDQGVYIRFNNISKDYKVDLIFN